MDPNMETKNKSSIIDNQEGNTLKERIELLDDHGFDIAIATAFFSIDALCLLANSLEHFTRIRLLFGDDASETERRKLLHDMKVLSEKELLKRREDDPLLSPLQKIKTLIMDGKLEARCYTARKFHAKAYLITRNLKSDTEAGIIGSGNFTRYGLTQNLELNVRLSMDQIPNLREWYEARWEEASRDIVSENVLAEIVRHIELYNPYVIYLKALFLWGTTIEVEGDEYKHSILDKLDIHQKKGYAQALRLIQKHHCAMICDGVGLGKSFIALAIMEHYCLQGKKVLLVAPKNILESAWNDYVDDYLNDFQGEQFGTLQVLSMTDFGFQFDPEKQKDGDRKKAIKNNALKKWADVIVIDESHNFRTSSAARSVNLRKALQPFNNRRKEIVLFSATPVNNLYMDMANQLSLMVPDTAMIKGFKPEQIRSDAAAKDKKSGGKIPPEAQKRLDLFGEGPLQETVNEVVIQRSRATCREWAAAEGKRLDFPKRNAPTGVEWQIEDSDRAWSSLLTTADKIFTSGVEFISHLDEEIKKAKAEQTEVESALLIARPPAQGLLFGAFLLEQYRKTENKDKKTQTDEIHLAKLIYTNTIKQLESSLPAFKGIIESLGAGLIARLKVVIGDGANEAVRLHSGWCGTPQAPKPLLPTVESPDESPESDEEMAEEGESLDYSGAETDKWLDDISNARGLSKKLKEFTPADYDIARWTEDVLSDLNYLRQIHELTVKAQSARDPKLEYVLNTVEQQLKQNRKVLIFTQSVRTSRYIEREFSKRLTEYKFARIDSGVTETRPAILHAFSPRYNRVATAHSVPASVDVLISTDVLSEGVNLQEAGAILNYDLPWNPTRLMQRIGRIDRRLNLSEGEIPHDFDVLNVIPPPPIERILKLVGRVQDRTIKIHRTLGLDQAFFTATDPEGTLKEFNKDYEGDIPSIARLQTEMVRTKANLTPEQQSMVNQLPPGGFGVWQGAPVNGFFGLYQWKATKQASTEDLDNFQGLIGEPLLILDREDDKVLTNAPEILDILSKTQPEQFSADPSGPEILSSALKRLKAETFKMRSSMRIPKGIDLELVCWMELRRDK